MMRKLFFSIIPVSLIVFFVACQLDVPIREMVEAKKKISRAYEVQADRFDPDTLKQATESLVRAHDYLKDEKIDKVKDEVKMANDAAEQAIATSLPLLADESIKAARTQGDTCDKVFAEKFAAEDQNTGKTLLKEAEGLLEQKEYWQAHLKAREAESILGRAVQTSLAHKTEISDRHDKLLKLHAKLASDPYASESKEELAVAAGKVAQAGEALSTDNLRDATQLLDDADNALKTAEGRISVRAEQVRAEQISKKKEEIKQRIGSLRGELAVLKSDPGARYAETELKTAENLLAESESEINSDSDKSVTKCDQAAEKIASAHKTIASGSLLERADALDLERTRLASDPDAVKFQEKLDNASLQISDGRALAQSGSFKESKNRLDEAENLLTLVKADIELIRGEKSGSVTVEEKTVEPSGTGKEVEPAKVQQRIYVVKYNRKNKDCLWRIAAHEYGNARLWPLIYVANKDTIKDPDLIFPGQKLVIPPLPEKTAKPETVKVDPASEPEKASSDTAPAPDSSPTAEEAPAK